MENQALPATQRGDDSPDRPESPPRSTYMSRLVGIGQSINRTIRRLQFEPEEQEGLAAQLSASFHRRHERESTPVRGRARQERSQGGRGRRAQVFTFRLVCLRRPERSSSNISYPELQDYGLGNAPTADERGYCTLPLHSTANDMIQLIEQSYPILRTTEYEVRRSERGGRLSRLESLVPIDLRDVFLAGRRRIRNPPTIFVAPLEEIHHRAMDTPTVMGRVTSRTGDDNSHVSSDHHSVQHEDGEASNQQEPGHHQEDRQTTPEHQEQDQTMPGHQQEERQASGHHQEDRQPTTGHQQEDQQTSEHQREDQQTSEHQQEDQQASERQQEDQPTTPEHQQEDWQASEHHQEDQQTMPEHQQDRQTTPEHQEDGQASGHQQEDQQTTPGHHQGDWQASPGHDQEDFYATPEVEYGDQQAQNTQQLSPQIHQTLSLEPEENRVNIFIRREQVIEDMTTVFSDDSIINTGVRVEVLGENAVDINGVFRDILTEFWRKFMDTASFEGGDQAAPRPSGSTTPEMWRAVGNILILGVKQAGYLPTCMSVASLIWAAFGAVSDTVLLNSWTEGLDCIERGSIKIVLDEGLNPEHMDTVIDILDRFRITTQPTSLNIRKLFLRAAHIHLVESAAYPLFQMRLQRLATIFKSAQELCDFRLSLLPDGDRVAGMLSAAVTNQRQQEIFNFLRRSVRAMDRARIGDFVRFVSGSDALTFRTITVQFVRLADLQRRFVAHTCGVVLDVPSTYTTFNELNRELITQLSSGQWEMNFI